MPIGFYDGDSAYVKGGTDDTQIGNIGNALIKTSAVSISYVQGSITVGTSQVEAKVGGSRLTNRQSLLIHNGSTKTIYVGPSGVTTSMRPIFKDQVYATDDANLAVFLIAATAGNTGVIIEEKGN